MLFNSIEFLIFLPIVFAMYWLVGGKRQTAQNFILLVSSYLFYGWWDWRFLSLIALSSLADFYIGQRLTRIQKPQSRKWLLTCSLGLNLGLLGVFKYYNWFMDSLVDSCSILGLELEFTTLSIVLPVGISFYTFQTLSYTIDVYRNKITPTNDLLAFLTYVSFFPQLVAGPIERAVNLLPQFRKNREFNYAVAVDGCRQILWGFFKKVAIADNCAIYVNDIFGDHTIHSGPTLILGAFLFAIQIYGDFSGYSDIAIGTSRLFGINLMRNFNFPYFSRDIAEFWRRWHISLSTWFKDYLYIPLGGSRGSTLMRIRNTFAIFLVSGLWHGANWTFVVWGGLNAIYFLPLLLGNKNRSNLDTIANGRLFPRVKETLQMTSTFGLTLIAWVYFRAENVEQGTGYLIHLFSDLYSKAAVVDTYNFIYWEGIYITLAGVSVLIVFEWLGRTQQHGLTLSKIEGRYALPTISRYLLYIAIIITTVIAMPNAASTFIYFQF
jgi:D-alanyl-lipoteichoic acid acyltransferase DltB (MBOAT superfamily)